MAWDQDGGEEGWWQETETESAPSRTRRRRSDVRPSASPTTLDTLVSLIAGDASGSPAALERLQRAQKLLVNFGAPLPTLEDVEARVIALAQRHRVNSDDELAEGLLFTFGRLKQLSEGERDGLLRGETFPELVHLLLSLASPPSQSTLEHAHSILFERDHPEPPPRPLTWLDIIASERLTGDPWDAIVARADPASRRFKPRLDSSSDEDDEQDALDSAADSSDSSISIETPSFPPTPNKNNLPRVNRSVEDPRAAHDERGKRDDDGLATLCDAQYWRRETTVLAGEINPQEPRSLAGALLALEADGRVEVVRDVWTEVDLVREVLGALQGRDTAGVFSEQDGVIQVRYNLFPSPVDLPRLTFPPQLSPRTPILLHLSHLSLRSLLSAFLPALSALSTLDIFLSHTLFRSSNTLAPSWGRTAEAFASSICTSLLRFRRWCAERETDLLNPLQDTAVSLLRLSVEIERRLGCLRKLVEGVRKMDRGQPGETAVALLDYLEEEVDRAVELGEDELAKDLRDAFVISVEPLWREFGEWVTKGRLGSASATSNSEKRNELFVHREPTIEFDDPDFFRDGFYIWKTIGNENTEGNIIPRIFTMVAEESLECGKVMHLLKTLSPHEEWLGDAAEWPTFSQLLGAPPTSLAEPSSEPPKPFSFVRSILIPLPRPAPSSTNLPPTLPALSALTPFSNLLPSLVHSVTAPLFHLIQHTLLHSVFVSQCSLRTHLVAIQGVFLMRNGWEVGAFCGGLFEKADRGEDWGDFQAINEGWRRAGGQAKVRFRVERGRGREEGRKVKALKRVHVDYAVPWPLVYILRPESMATYTRIFQFLLQLRRGKHLVDRLSLVKVVPEHSTATGSVSTRYEVKLYYTVRRKLAWIVATLWEFFMAAVVQMEVDAFNAAVEGLTSVQQLVDLHDSHVTKLRDRLLLNDKAFPIHNSIIALLELCVSLSDTWTTFNVDSFSSSATFAPRRQPRSQRRHARRRRTAEENSDSSSDDDDTEGKDDEAENEETTTFGPSVSFVSFAEEGFGQRVKRIDKEIEESLGFVKRGVEALAKNAASREGAEVFGWLVARLED